MRVPAWAWTIGWMTALTAQAWTSFWVKVAEFLVWRYKWSETAYKKDLQYVFNVFEVATKAIVFILLFFYRVLGKWGMGYAKFVSRRAKDFDWVDRLDG